MGSAPARVCRAWTGCLSSALPGHVMSEIATSRSDDLEFEVRVDTLAIDDDGSDGGSEEPFEDGEAGSIRGQVIGQVPDGSRVRVVLVTLTGSTFVEEIANEAAVGEDGWFRVDYRTPAFADSTSD